MDMSPQTITLPPNMLLQAASRSLSLQQTLSRLSDGLRGNLLSSVKSTGHQCWTCQFWYSMQIPIGLHDVGLWHYRTSGPQATFKKSVSDWLFKDIYTNGLLEVICSSLHKGADTRPADGLKTFYDHVQLS